MAEILGIVSGAITLLETAYKALECFIDAYNAPKEQPKLLAEMSTLRPMLVELERRVQANPSSPILAQMKEPLETFKTSMAQLTEKLSEGQTLPLQKRLTWSWIKKEAGTYLDEFERIKSSISIWLNMYTGYDAPTASVLELIPCIRDVVQTGHQGGYPLILKRGRLTVNLKRKSNNLVVSRPSVQGAIAEQSFKASVPKSTTPTPSIRKPTAITTTSMSVSESQLHGHSLKMKAKCNTDNLRVSRVLRPQEQVSAAARHPEPNQRRPP